MRKLLLSTASIAALVTVAACSDQSAEVEQDNPAAIEETATVDTTVPSVDEQQTLADSQPSGDAVTGDDTTAGTQMQADAQTGDETMPEGEATADAELDPTADVEEAEQAIADARDAIETESEAAAVQALIQVERAIDGLDDPQDAQEAVDTVRNEVVSGNFDAALAALDDVELALQANGQAAAQPEVSDETTASTTE